MFVEWIAGKLTGGVIGAVLSPLRDMFGKFTDARVINRQTDAKVTRKVIESVLREREIEANLILAAMKHPVWWVAWGLIVFPPAFYHASVFMVSILDMFLNEPGCAPRCAWYVKRVPAEQEKLARDAIAFVIGAHVSTGAIAGLTQVADRFLKGR